MNENSKAVEDDLLALAAMSDDEIDTSDIPERTNFKGGVRRRFFNLSLREYDVRAIANWCIAKAKSAGVRTSSLWLNKLVFFIYEGALVHNRVLLTPARAEAWDHGPVFREIFSQTDGDKEVEFLTKFDVELRTRVLAEEKFQELDIALFESIWNKYGHLSASEVRRISHLEGTPWYKVWYQADVPNPGKVIDINDIIGHIGLNYGKDS